jgi:predicted transposase/invertase (TIGR01784 family)
MPYDDIIVPELLPLQSISQNEDERTRFRMRRKFQMDMDHNLIASRDEGRAEGRAEGVLAIAKKMLEANMPVDTIVKLSGLTHNEVENLKKP